MLKRFLPIIFICFLIFISLNIVSAQTTSTAKDQSQKDLDALKQQILDKNAEIQKIQTEIDLYTKQIAETGKEASTLKGAIKKLETAKAKLTNEIKLTGKKIQASGLNIERLGMAIDEKKGRINRGLYALQNSIRTINEIEKESAIEILLGNKNIYDGWNDVENLAQFEGGVSNQLEQLKALKQQLESSKTQSEKEKNKLTSLKSQLSDQQKIVEQNKQEKNKLLTETKNKESGYQKILADRIAKKNALEQEILDFESRLKISVDSSLLPKVGKGILAYPLDFIKITQFFGTTPFATANPQVYGGMGHNGVDFQASPGTPVKAADDGTVFDVGNTDAACYGVSFGKWIMIKHPNGLATLYSHLSLMKVAPGENVVKGEVIAYSGNTGYTTGPHLHFGVYASQAVHISGPTEFKSRLCGTYMKLPLAPRNAYLNPLSYL